MKIGLTSDMHFGYTHGSKVNEAGVNVREQDFYDAAFLGLHSLLSRGVDIIVDGGDIAHVPAPKKRAISNLINLINQAEIPFYSVDGNHTSLKSSSDIHLYDILNQECKNFHGFIGHGITHHGIAMVPHAYDPNITMSRIEEVMKIGDPIMLVGHFAATDIVYDNARVPFEFLPADIPVFLGHYHRHTEQVRPLPTYIGSTEHTAWDQWNYPTGVSIYDTSAGTLEYITHHSRKFVNLLATDENYLDIFDEEDLTDAVVRLTIETGREKYGTLNLRETKRKAQAAGALSFHYRRAKDKKDETNRVEAQEVTSLTESWNTFVDDISVDDRDRVRELGIEALNA